MAKANKPCGTDAGYARHRRAGEEACAMCRHAHTDYHRNYRVSNIATRNREAASTVAWNAAVKRLRLRYDALFHRYYAEELAKVGLRPRGVVMAEPTPLTQVRFTIWCSCGSCEAEASVLDVAQFIHDHPDCQHIYCKPFTRLVDIVISEAERALAGKPPSKLRWRK